MKRMQRNDVADDLEPLVLQQPMDAHREHYCRGVFLSGSTSEAESSARERKFRADLARHCPRSPKANQERAH
jgi:hypothetical protein